MKSDSTRRFVPSQNSIRNARRKLSKARTRDYEALRRTLDKLEREFERLAQENAKRHDTPGAEPVSFEDWEKKLNDATRAIEKSVEEVEHRPCNDEEQGHVELRLQGEVCGYASANQVAAGKGVGHVLFHEDLASVYKSAAWRALVLRPWVRYAA